MTVEFHLINEDKTSGVSFPWTSINLKEVI